MMQSAGGKLESNSKKNENAIFDSMFGMIDKDIVWIQISNLWMENRIFEEHDTDDDKVITCGQRYKGTRWWT